MPSIWERILEILDYQGNETDTLINWTMLVISIVPFFLQTSLHLGTLKRVDSNYWPFHLVFYFIFQIVLCLLLECVGISIVWNAMMGLLITYFQLTNLFKHKKVINWFRSKAPTYRIYLIACILSWVMGFGVDIYYLIIETFITTLAHFLAIILGLVTGYLSKKISFEIEKQDSNENISRQIEEKESLFENADSN